tara:strand:- start:719 stop:970 length:252 start_codon:yes stop_codon:yes gene_type:complete
MIDTDKYEGVKGSLVHSISNEEWKKLSPAGQALVADAPLLLAEVKRLRLAIQNVADFPKRCPPALKLEGVIDAMVCTLREAIE